METFETAITYVKNGGKAKRDFWRKNFVLDIKHRGTKSAYFIILDMDTNEAEMPYSIREEDIFANDWILV